jgi:hypothetical protein
VICDKAKECLPTFDLSYPGGVSECVTKTKAEAAKKYGDDLDRRSTCTDAELDRCLEQLRAAACPGGGALPKAPCEC